jgi:hypothetical protein
MIFNRIICPSSNYFGYLCPLVPECLMCLNELHLLEVTPLLFIDGGVQVVVPSKLINGFVWHIRRI